MTPEADVQPKYQRLRSVLLDEISRLAPHAALPTERELAARHHVSRNTVRLALDALDRAGIVYRLQGAGTFVAGPTISKSLSLSSFSEDMTVRGWSAVSRVVAADEIPADESVAADLQLEVGEPVIRVNRVRLADGTPICLELAHFAAARTPGLLDYDLSGSLYEVLQTNYRLQVVRAEQIVRAVSLSAVEASILHRPPEAPALQIHRIGVDQRDNPLESTTSTYRADLYDLRFAIQR